MDVNEIKSNGGSKVADTSSLDDFIKANHKKKFRFGIIAALLCAVYWGVWYVPGYAVWEMPDFLPAAMVNMENAGYDSDVTYTMACILLCLVNAIIDTLILFIWNGALGKMGELKRTFVEFKAANIYFLYAGICGAGAVFGTYVAAQFLNPGFAAVAGVLYALVGTIMSVLYLHQKVTKRGYIAVVIMIVGAFVLFAGTIFGGAESSNMTLGIIGGAMCAICWGLEGTFAGKALDYCEPDCGIQLRFFWETVLWIIVCVVLAISGVPIFSTMASIVTDPYILLVVILLGFSFAWCYVTWYKSFPFIGVARGQAIGSLYAACSIVFMVLFFGVDNAIGGHDMAHVLPTIGGLIICLFGSYLIATEDAEGLVSLKDDSVMGGE
ncbi:MAG: DMT family transporter [Thermoplasmata archaeon]|jgi:drug/metabolite transporter (DMT)-like permease|nr:DMT family transporter [Thermoplasmata archaeon]